MPYKDPAAQREYQRLWKAQRRAEWFADKVCVDCGGTDRLELDHIDRTTKVSHKIWSWSAERREAELAKCVARCHDCHDRKSRIVGDHGSSQRRIPWEVVSEIRERAEAGESPQSLAARLGLSDRHVRDIVDKKRRAFA